MRLLSRVLFTLLVALLGSCAMQPLSQTGEPAAVGIDGDVAEGLHLTPGPFPMPAELAPAVAFWRHVFGHWGVDQVVLHDRRHLGLIYEVIDLPDGPGRPDAGYTPAQRAMLDEHVTALRARLASIEARLQSGQPLDAAETELHAHIVSHLGPQGVAGSAERLRSQRGLRERFRRGLEISGRFDARFREIFRAAGLPEDLALLPHVESSFQLNARSTAGAVGVWQFTPPAARQYLRYDTAIDERLDPIASAEGAARYLSDAYRRLGSWSFAVTAYNHGIGGMARARAAYGDDFGRLVQEYAGPNFGFASRNFYAEFLAAREVALHPARHFPEGLAAEQPQRLDELLLPAPTDARRVAGHYGLSVPTLAALNPAWLAPALSGKALLPAGTRVWLPAGSTLRLSASGMAALPDPLAPARSRPRRR